MVLFQPCRPRKEIDLKTLPAVATKVHVGRSPAVVLVGEFSGLRVSEDGGAIHTPARPWSVWIPDEDGKLHMLSAAGNAGSAFAVPFGSVQAALDYVEAKRGTSTSSGAAGDANAYTVDATTGIQTPTVAGLDLTSATARVQTILARFNNAAAVYIADTQAKAALLDAAGGGFELTGGASKRWKGTLWVAAQDALQRVFVNQEVD